VTQIAGPAAHTDEIARPRPNTLALDCALFSSTQGEFHARTGEPNVSRWTAESFIEDACKIGEWRKRKVLSRIWMARPFRIWPSKVWVRVHFIATNCQHEKLRHFALLTSNLLNRPALTLGADSAAVNCTCDGNFI